MLVGAVSERSLTCANHHCFDVSAKGYINLLLPNQRRSSTPGYNAEMLRSRMAVMQLGLFAPLSQAIAELIRNRTASPRPPRTCTLLDVGCGEGHVLSAVMSHLRADGDMRPLAIGLDISRHAISMSCRHEGDMLCCVANLATQLPFVTGAFQVVTNILAPSNPAEFRRVLRDGGVLLKVVPMRHHLAELRHALYERPREHPCGADEAVAELSGDFDVAAQRRLSYGRELPRDCIRDIIRMTSLFWKAKRQRIEALERAGLTRLTVDLSIIVGIARAAA
jgi:23S rRNA (guanine745-N1)-methyltransferase